MTGDMVIFTMLVAAVIGFVLSLLAGLSGEADEFSLFVLAWALTTMSLVGMVAFGHAQTVGTVSSVAVGDDYIYDDVVV